LKEVYLYRTITVALASKSNKLKTFSPWDYKMNKPFNLNELSIIPHGIKPSINAIHIPKPGTIK